MSGNVTVLSCAVLKESDWMRWMYMFRNSFSMITNDYYNTNSQAAETHEEFVNTKHILEMASFE